MWEGEWAEEYNILHFLQPTEVGFRTPSPKLDFDLQEQTFDMPGDDERSEASTEVAPPAAVGCATVPQQSALEGCDCEVESDVSISFKDRSGLPPFPVDSRHQLN